MYEQRKRCISAVLLCISANVHLAFCISSESLSQFWAYWHYHLAHFLLIDKQELVRSSMYILSVLANNRYSWIEITGETNKSLIDIVREIQHVRWPSLPEWTNFSRGLAKIFICCRGYRWGINVNLETRNRATITLLFRK